MAYMSYSLNSLTVVSLGSSFHFHYSITQRNYEKYCVSYRSKKTTDIGTRLMALYEDYIGDYYRGVLRRILGV